MTKLRKSISLEKARRHLADYSRYVFGLEPAAHHLEWLELLENVKATRILIIAPPESAKSTYVSIVFPTWYIGKHVEDASALVSCTSTQAQEFGGAITRVIEQSPEYHEVFPNVVPDKIAGWSKDHIFVIRKNQARPDPTMMMTGVGGPIIGRRYNLVVVDDPTDQDIAYSEVQRERQKRWFKQTLLSRIVRGGRCIVILTRWHEDDLAAELMKPKMRFKVVHLPALTDGKSYWPEHWPVEALQEKRDEVGSDIFRCMYLGEPSDATGTIFKRDWFRYFTTLPAPEEIRGRIQVWDTALKGGRKHDYSVCATGCIDRHHQIYIESIFRAQIEAPELDKAILSQHKTFHPALIGIEDKVAGSSAIQRLRREHSLPIVEIKAFQNKELRAHGVTPYFERGEIQFKAGMNWVDDLEHELLAFPNGKYDDQVDAVVHLITRLQEIAPRFPNPGREQKSGIEGLAGIRTKTF